MYYIRLVFDYVDDDYNYHMIVSFNSLETVTTFKETFDNTNINGIYINTNKMNEWLKEYNAKPLKCQPKPNKVTEMQDIQTVIDNIKKITSRELFHIRKHRSDYTSDYIFTHKSSTYSIDENQLVLTEIKKIMCKETEENDINKECDFYYDEDFGYSIEYFNYKYMNKNEFDEMCENATILTQEFINKMNYEDSYFVLMTHVNLELYQTQIKIKKRYTFTRETTILHNKYSKWHDILYNDPENFITYDTIKENFADKLEELQEELVKLNEIISFEEIKKLNKHDYNKHVSDFYYKYIKKTYHDKLNEIQKNKTPRLVF